MWELFTHEITTLRLAGYVAMEIDGDKRREVGETIPLSDGKRTDFKCLKRVWPIMGRTRPPGDLADRERVAVTYGLALPCVAYPDDYSVSQSRILYLGLADYRSVEMHVPNST